MCCKRSIPVLDTGGKRALLFTLKGNCIKIVQSSIGEDKNWGSTNFPAIKNEKYILEWCKGNTSIFEIEESLFESKFQNQNYEIIVYEVKQPPSKWQKRLQISFISPKIIYGGVSLIS